MLDAHLASALEVDLEHGQLTLAAARAPPGRAGVPYLARPCTTAYSRNSPASTSRSNSASSTKW